MVRVCSMVWCGMIHGVIIVMWYVMLCSIVLSGMMLGMIIVLWYGTGMFHGLVWYDPWSDNCYVVCYAMFHSLKWYDAWNDNCSVVWYRYVPWSGVCLLYTSDAA